MAGQLAADWPSSVRTARSGQHLELVLDPPLGQGGEGVVFRTHHGGLAVKLCNGGSAMRLEDRLGRLRWLPLQGVPICRPLEPLAAPHVGYVMELLQDMVAFSAVCAPTSDDVAGWYAQGGGLRRRLRLLARCAAILGTLHDRGIVYGDVSPGNVLVSAQPEHDEVWLVDADNLQTESGPGSYRLITAYYAAPEVLRGTSGNTVFSDVYSFAVLAYETLTTNHPLIGDYVDQGPAELEDDAQHGLLPWIEHSTDDRNRTTYGYPAERVLTRQLLALFRRTFEDGIHDPRSRPGAGEWAAALDGAADRCVQCSKCPHSYVVAKDRCPWCGADRPAVVPVLVREQFPWLGDRRPLTLEDKSLTLFVQADRPLLVTARTVYRGAADPLAVVAEVDWDGGDSLVVRNRGTSVIRRVPPKGGLGRSLLPGGRADESLSAAWTWHFGDDSRPHRMLVPQPAEVTCSLSS
ncbi:MULTISPECIES: protein kinase domain-containing protein [unclassified Micromonospora]|uniref:protein kinase domain-containing protein n=1 Tax=unclassified Micromonospora TaxID=2617518 RepID=UPI002FF0EA58